VDGFRFDPPQLARGESGAVMANPPVLWDIETTCQWRAEVYCRSVDVSGSTRWVADRDSWKEWNGRFATMPAASSAVKRFLRAC
jgi:glycogen operon protein